MTKTAYIAGPVSGHDINQVRELFEAKESELRDAGYGVCNPVREVAYENDFRESFGFGPEKPLLNDDDTRHLTLRYCIGLLVQCDEIHMLPGWQFSEGAQIEHRVAELLKIKIVEAP